MTLIEQRLAERGLVLPAEAQLPPGVTTPFRWVRTRGCRTPARKSISERTTCARLWSMRSQRRSGSARRHDHCQRSAQRARADQLSQPPERKDT